MGMQNIVSEEQRRRHEKMNQYVCKIEYLSREGEWILLADDIIIQWEDGTERNNRNLQSAFREQYPDLMMKVPQWTDNRGFHFQSPIVVHPFQDEVEDR
jgi:hypothetical protein